MLRLLSVTAEQCLKLSFNCSFFSFSEASGASIVLGNSEQHYDLSQIEADYPKNGQTVRDIYVVHAPIFLLLPLSSELCTWPRTPSKYSMIK